MPEIHLKQLSLDFHIVLVFHSLKTKKELKNLCRQEAQIVFTRMILVKVVLNIIKKCKELTERTESDKVLIDKAFIITSYPKYYGNQKGLVSMLYKFFMKNSLAVV